MSDARKPKLSVDRQIAHLADEGVKFEITSREEARVFLTERTYFHKLKSYCDNYIKDEAGRYINLDFAYLIDLSTIDMYLRRFINTLTLNVEHILKTKLLADFNESPFDGYDIVNSFLNDDKGKKAREYIKNIIRSKDTTNYCPELPSDINDLPIWKFIEIVQFGHLHVFCNHFYETLKKKINKATPNFIALDRACKY